jgi:hypothetical protein
MLVHLTKLLGKLWNDDCGAVISTEYMALGSVVVLGSIGGLAAMRDASVSEMQEYGNAVQSLDQSYTIPSVRGGGASKGGTAAYDSPPAPKGGQRGGSQGGGYQFTPPEDLLASP